MRAYITFLLLIVLFACNQKEETVRYYKVEGNPLFNDFNETIDFSALTAAHIAEATDSIISYAKGEFQQLYQLKPDERNFENTMVKLDDIYNDLSRIGSAIYLVGNTHPDSLIRNTALEKNTVMDKYLNEVSLDEELYKVVKAYSKTEEAAKLTGYKEKFLRETVEGFERNGFALSKEDRAKLKEIKDAISEVGNAFNKNIAAYQDHLIVSEKEIAGLPEDYKKARKHKNGSYKIDLSYPSYLPFMKYSQSDEARRKLYIKYYNRAPENLEVLRNLLQKRKEMVDLLGYDSYADWRLEDRMAKESKIVWEFEENLAESIRPKAALDYQELVEAKKAKFPGGKSSEIDPWESSYINNILLEEKYQLDDEEVKQYFPLDNVLEGLFQITQTIFNVTYREVENPSVWHSDVRLFEVIDNGKLIGRFYLDLFPRENKFTHAACFGIIKGKNTPQGYQVPNASLVCNFPAPTNEKPSLLPHDQVETMFHEFGHVLHQMLTKADLSVQSGTSVARDFVEAPSQIFENWAWNYESLKLFAKHYETGEVLPKELYDKMIAAKNVGSGIFTETQIFYGLVDMTLHDRFDPNGDETTTDVVKRLREDITHFPFVENTHFEAAFGHLNGYGASYYGYLWSRVYAEDMFSLFEKNGVLDTETGMKYRNIILARGSAEEPMDLVVEFLGREPNNDAFMKSLGL